MASSHEDDNRAVFAVDGGIHKLPSGIVTGASAAVLFCFYGRWLRRIEIVSDFRTSNVTNNRMELGGFILGGKFLTTTIPARRENFPKGEPYFKSIEFWSDSQYALGVLFRKNWHPRDNLALVAQGKKEIQKVQDFFGTPVSGHFIRGHKGYFINELADLAAQRAIQKMRSFQHSLAIRAICEECAFCEHFPCEIPGRQARTWKRRFVLIAHGETYCRDTSVCSGRKAYESEFKLLA